MKTMESKLKEEKRRLESIVHRVISFYSWL